jgi:hypothetical protein
MDKWRVDGQCYDSFLLQLVSLWEKTHGNGKSRGSDINQDISQSNDKLKKGWLR